MEQKQQTEQEQEAVCVYKPQSPAVIDEQMILFNQLDYLGVIVDHQQQKQPKQQLKNTEALKLLKDFLSRGRNANKVTEDETVNYILRSPKNTQITELKMIMDKVETYLDYDEFLSDLINLVRNSYIPSYGDYLTNLLHTIIQRSLGNQKNKFQLKLNTDIEKLFKDGRENSVKQWVIPQSEDDFRKFQFIEENIVNGDGTIEEFLGSSLKAIKCEDNCDCKLGSSPMPMSQQCYNVTNRLKCPKECNCENSFSLDFIDYDGNFQEVIAWGMDFYTKKNLYYMMQNQGVEKREEFLERILPRAMNQQYLLGHDISNSLNFILDKKKFNYGFTDEHRLQAQQLLKALTFDKEKTAFRLHTKGKGVVCAKLTGFKAGQVVSKYIGEVYSTSRWFDKQDLAKQGQKMQSEFFQISYWRSDLEELNPGVAIFIDPINKGNQSSRFSHSCRANCQAREIILDGQYQILMIALCDIEFGDELTFDYSSVTTSQKEHKDAICLCGMINANHYYLKYQGWRKSFVDWELKNLEILLHSLESNQDWMSHWYQAASNEINGISNKNINSTLSCSLKYTLSRINNYFSKSGDPQIKQKHPLRLLSMSETVALFIGRDNQKGEFHYILSYLEALNLNELVSKVKSYFNVMRGFEMSKQHDHIHVLLQYLHLRTQQTYPELSERLRQRSHIRRIITANDTLPVVNGHSFKQEDFGKMQLPQLSAVYMKEFLWRVTNDLNQDSRLDFLKVLLSYYGVFRYKDSHNRIKKSEYVKSQIKAHIDFLNSMGSFYSYYLDQNNPKPTMTLQELEWIIQNPNQDKNFDQEPPILKKIRRIEKEWS